MERPDALLDGDHQRPCGKEFYEEDDDHYGQRQ
jgi:hypothetical protein